MTTSCRATGAGACLMLLQFSASGNYPECLSCSCILWLACCVLWQLFNHSNDAAHALWSESFGPLTVVFWCPCAEICPACNL